MRVLGTLLVTLLCMVTSVGAQTLQERAALAQTPEFQARVGVAAMQAAIAVAIEDPATASHDVRMQLATWTITEPEIVARKLSYLVASVDSISAAATDEQIKTLLSTYWTTISSIFLTRR